MYSLQLDQALSTARKLRTEDLHLVHTALHDLSIKLKRANRKVCHGFIDVPVMLQNIANRQHAYIVAGYLVIYEMGRPWYAADDVLFLSEQLVLRIAVSGDFREVPLFLEQKAREAGCQLLLAGTALAKSDPALASLYYQHGFHTEGYSLIKEL